jgi:hypothetical protein
MNTRRYCIIERRNIAVAPAIARGSSCFANAERPGFSPGPPNFGS